MSRALTKAEALAHWRALQPQAVRLPRPVRYKAKGSTYGEDGLRLEGSREFIDSILANLQPLLAGEGAETRLAVAYQPVKCRETGAETGQWVCYVKTHERGPEARRFNLQAERGRARRADQEARA